MEKITLGEGLMAQMMESEAWQSISGNYRFSEAQLEKFADKVDWEQVSGNNEIAWTIPMLEKFKNRIRWDKLASNNSKEFASIDLLDKFKELWDWDEYSDSGDFTMEILEKFADKLNWKNVINNWNIRNLDAKALLDKFGDRIPVTEFKDSRLWGELVEQKETEVKRILCLG